MRRDLICDARAATKDDGWVCLVLAENGDELAVIPAASEDDARLVAQRIVERPTSGA